jgi:hypothetical protein
MAMHRESVALDGLKTVMANLQLVETWSADVS